MDASSGVTSRPSVIIVAVCWRAISQPIAEFLEGRRLNCGSESSVSLLDALLGVDDGRSTRKPSMRDSSVKSTLLPARRRVRLGEAKARASFRNVGRALKEA